MPTATRGRANAERQVERFHPDELHLDETNPRLQAGTGESLPQRELIKKLWQEFAVDEVALSIAANGYYDYEPLFATREAGQLVVVEGNRRLAAVKLLLDPDLRREVGATDLPRASSKVRSDLQALPVVVIERGEIWQYLGFKHVNGPQAWQPLSKARYIAWVHNELQVPLTEIAKQIGDQHATVFRLYRALMALEHGEEAGVFIVEDRWKPHFSFSHLYTGFDYSGIQEFIGLNPERKATPKPLPKAKLKEFGELCVWLYGSKSRNRPPLVQSQNPDLRLLDEVLQTVDGTAALRSGLPLKPSLDISKGDSRLFREALVAAKQSLQEARGTLLTGYEGEPDLVDTATDIAELAESIVLEMQAIRKKRRAGQSRSRAT